MATTHGRNGSGSVGDPALRVRVDNLAEDIHSVRTEIRDIRVGISAEISALATKIDERGRPQYSLLLSLAGFMLLFMTTVGGLAYWPINTATSDLKAAVVALSERSVTLRQYDNDAALARTDRQSLRAELAGYVGNTIQQQRYNTDKTARDAEITILRERFDKVLTRTEFDSQHGDLRHLVEGLVSARDKQLAEVSARIIRLEDAATGAARTGAKQEDLDKRFDAISLRLAEHIRDTAIRGKGHE